ncbi:DUF305 domain-containing protein [Yinghuangia sp. ASG 101]|uniref:DUF305 domain-containing protein n=1 Tax=Yinghuangia sp. ASG 101 TaxID=2896848 RepID=UPI001E34A5B0|nr:DUF305 domain-containing protein [Yinghuangia sp. ASG 101]UGQ11469.1 DUF305 domain-containing protein [Yinghuangia sp. ASG 101]
MKRHSRRIALTSAAVAGALVLAACADDGNGHDRDDMTGTPAASAPTGPGSPQPSAATFNDADVMFAQMMIVHHEQAVDMAREAPAKAVGDQVKQLAAQIEAAQAPEIARMRGWLTTWGRPATAPGGMDHGDGMMTDRDMAGFKAATGTEFDRMFLTMMIAHHNGAIRMADDELVRGVNPEARKLAEQIKTSQAAEVQRMRQLLGDSTSPTPSGAAPTTPGTHH